MTEGVNPMPDPKLAGSPIVQRTMCRVGAHMWIQSASTMAYVSAGINIHWSPTIYCDCGAYTWAERERVVP